jgi:thiamine-monophosphate kinase
MRLDEIGELALIERIAGGLPGRSDVVVGVGDDCAVVGGGCEEFVLTTDPVIEGVHFEAGTQGADIGHKAVGRVLSDIAAMGAEPRWVLVNVVAPAETDLAVVDGIYRGMNALAAEFKTAVVGGDVARGPVLELHVFGVGAVPAGKAVLRSGGGAGDKIFVTGALGGSRLGRHLRVEPRVQVGIFLREWASAMIDVSDGLSGDLRHLTEMSGVGALLQLDHVPVAEAAKQLEDGVSALEHALYDGEDFELLFCVPAERVDEFKRSWPFEVSVTEIGELVAEPGVYVVAEDSKQQSLERGGFAHFG